MAYAPFSLNLLVLGVCTFVAYCFYIAIYRLYLHPLAKFPGPKLPALTIWHEFYYDVIKRGVNIWNIQEWHKQYGNAPLPLEFLSDQIPLFYQDVLEQRTETQAYDGIGPIIRINPNEIHIDDPDYWDEIYAPASKKRNKYGWWTRLAGAPGSVFSTVPHDVHRMRRAALNPFFSKRSVTQLEPIIREKVEKLADRFEAAVKTREVIRFDAAYMALTMDVITQYAYARSYNYLAEPDFKLEWKYTLIGGFEMGATMRHLPWMAKTPDWLVKVINPGMMMFFSWQRDVKRQVKSIMESRDAGAEKASNTIFHELLDSNLPSQEKTLGRLADEGEILIGAGSETTAMALSHISFYMLQNRTLLEKLRAELRGASPDPKANIPWSKLEQLPYLSAVISEGLRLSYGTTTRLPRIAPNEVLNYNGWEIPAGTPVSQTPYLALMNPRIFPHPEMFDPDRWITAAQNGHRLDRYLVSFARGSRQCLGINLAYAELYLTAATIFRRFEMELFETTIEDVQMAHDFFVGVPKLDSKGVRAVITGLLD